LRSEIAQRVATREDASTIEADLVARYGDKIRALPPGGDPRWVIGAAALGAMIVGMLAIVGTVRRRGRRAVPAPIPQPASAEALDAYADRLDDELADLADLD
jgi:cytochrome c-type biogenesis protein CcmH